MRVRISPSLLDSLFVQRIGHRFPKAAMSVQFRQRLPNDFVAQWTERGASIPKAGSSTLSEVTKCRSTPKAEGVSSNLASSRFDSEGRHHASVGQRQSRFA